MLTVNSQFYFFLILILLLSFFCFQTSLKIHAQVPVPQIIISEVYAQPDSGEQEWIELQNLSNETINLNHWYITDVLSSPAVIYQFDALANIAEQEKIVINLNSQKLNNTADGVRLIDANGIIHHSMDYSSSTKKLSWQFLNNSWCEAIPTPLTNNVCGNNLNNPPINTSSTISAQTSQLPSPLPTPTPSPTPTAASESLTHLASNLQITEVSPCPSDNREWIEVYNPNSHDIEVFLTIVDDQQNKRYVSGEAKANQYAVLYLSSSILNNAGDRIKITGETGELLNLSYEACPTGQSLGLLNNVWDWLNPTPGGENQPNQNSSPPLTQEISKPIFVSSGSKESQTSTQTILPSKESEKIQINKSDSPTIVINDVWKNQVALPKVLAQTEFLTNAHIKEGLNDELNISAFNSVEYSSDNSNQISPKLKWLATILITLGGWLIVYTSYIPSYAHWKQKYFHLVKRRFTPSLVGQFNFFPESSINSTKS